MVTTKVVTGAKAMLTAEIVRTVSKGVIVLLLTRVFLTPEQYGLLFFALSVLGVAILFASLGLAKSGARYVAEYSQGDTTQIPHVLTTTLKYNLVTIVVVGTVIAVFSDRISHLMGEPRLRPFLLIGVGYVVVLSLRRYTRLIFQGFSRVAYSAATSIVANVGILLSIVGFLFLGAGAIGALSGYIVGHAIATVAAFVLLYTKFYKRYDRAQVSEPGLSRRILKYAVPLSVTRGATLLDKRIDTILVGLFLSPVAVGFYTLGKQISSFAVAPATSLGFSVAPAYGEYKATDELSRAARLYETTFTYTMALYVPATVGLFLVAEPLVRVVFGLDYLGAVPVLQIFSLYVLLQSIDKITNDSLDYLGRARVRAYARGGSSVGNFLLNLVAIPVFGVVGAAGATVLTYSALLVVELWVVYRDLPVSAVELLRTTILITGIAAGMGGVVLVLVPFAENIFTLGAVVAAGIGVWLLLSTLTGVLSVDGIRSVLS